MPFSHHSHSGQFCGHAVNTLEEVVQDAIRKGMTSLCMTEHIARDRVDFYPGEEEVHTPESLEKLFDGFYHEARRLQKAYADQISLYVGFETEWIRGSSLRMIQGLLERYDLDLIVGSVHHVHTHPIDYDTVGYQEARLIAGGADEHLFADYFDAQYAMLQALKPPVVGHFDLIRLKSDHLNGNLRKWPKVWEKVMRNLEFVAGYGGVLELNSSALRKGMTEAYPQVEVCKEFRAMGGCFTFSDDSHGVEQIGLNYDKVLMCVKRAGITKLSYLRPVSKDLGPHDARFPKVGWQAVEVSEVEKFAFWKS